MKTIKKIKNWAGNWEDAQCPYCGQYPRVLETNGTRITYDCGCDHNDRISAVDVPIDGVLIEDKEEK